MKPRLSERFRRAAIGFLRSKSDGPTVKEIDPSEVQVPGQEVNRAALQRGVLESFTHPDPEADAFFVETIEEITQALRDGKQVGITTEMVMALQAIGEQKGIDRFVMPIAIALKGGVTCEEIDDGTWIIRQIPMEIVQEINRQIMGAAAEGEDGDEK